MNAGKVKTEIEEAIEIANSSAITYYVTAEDGSGTLSAGQLRLKKKESFDILFTPSDEWKFICWEVLDRNSGEVVTDSIEFRDAAKLEVHGTVVNPKGNLTIHAKAVKLPFVSEISPSNSSSGCDQDTTIKITFNKSIDVKSFEDYGNISFAARDGKSLNEYYDTPFFSNDNTVLNIPTTKGKFLIPLGADANTTLDIIITIKLKDVTDVDGLALSDSKTYTYRVNKKVDDIKPVFDSIVLKSTGDKQSPYYKILTATAYDDWQATPTQEFAFGHYSQNHVTNTVFFEAAGSDEGSGIAAVKVKETWLYKTDATTATNETVIHDVPCVKQEEFYTAQCNLKTYNDGIIKLELSLVDFAGNISENTKTYYVLKDTVIQTKSVKFLEIPVEENGSYGDKSSPRKIKNNLDTISFTLDEENTSKDSFYDSFSTAFVLDYYWGYSESTINNKMTKNGNTYSFSRDPEKTVYVNVIVSDEAGNEVLKYFTFPPKINCFEFSHSPDRKSFTLFPFPEGLSYSNSSTITGRVIIVYMWADEMWSQQTFGFSRNTDSGVEMTYTSIANKCKGKNLIISPALGIIGPNGELGISPINEDCYYTIHFDDSGTIDSITQNGNQSQPDTSYINTPVKITATPILSTGNYEITIDEYIPQELNADNIKYKITFVSKKTTSYNWDMDRIVYTGYDTHFCVPAKRIYINIEAITPEGIFKKEMVPFYFSDNPQTILTFSDLSADVTPPAYDSSWKYIQTPSSLETSFRDSDSGFLWQDGFEAINYWLIPSNYTSMDDNKFYTLQELDADYENYKKQIHIKKGLPSIDNPNTDNIIAPYIPLGDVEEGLYTLCIEAKDKKGNKKVYCIKCFNKMFGQKLTYQLESNGTIELNSLPGITFNRWELQYKKWSESLNPISSSFWSKYVFYKKGNNDIYSAGYYDTEYFYYPKTNCTIKNAVQGINGLTVYCDAPTLVHVLYCPKKLTETSSPSDAQVWINKGIDLNPKTGSTTFTYGAENYEDVQDGFWYTTIVHFADGTMAMGEIFQK